MSKINLTEEELKQLLNAINAGAEPSPVLAGKIFPSLMEKLGQEGKFDFETLNRIKIPTIEYAGKRSEGVILASAAAIGQSAPLQVVRNFGEPGKDGWKNLIVQGDNLQFLKTVYLNQDPLIKDKVKGKVRLIFIDPPFGTGDEYGGRGGQNSYSAKLAGSEFIEGLRERSIFLKEILTNNGIFIIRIDHHFGHYVKVTLDEIFGKHMFQCEIIVNRIKKNVTQQGRQSLPTANDSLFVYFKSEESKFISVFKKLVEEKCGYWRAMDSAGVRSNPTRVIENQTFSPPAGRHFTFNQKRVEKMYSEGKIRLNPKTNRPEYWVDPKDETALDTNWTDISGYTFTTGYPTENSELLLERVLSMTTDIDDIVMDVFGGSGTTAAVAEKLGRRWITCDFGKHAIYTMQKRILNIADSKSLNGDKKDAKYGKPPTPFAVASVGAYDFTRIMNMRENKCAYISFVLALFGIPKEAKDFIRKYKLDHIYAEKDGNPVEIFPVWDDEFLYNVRIDRDYLQDIITQSRGRLKGNFYIVVPESCTQISDMKLPNGTGGEVHFRFLKFPYSILEQASRNFAIEDQPDTPANINNLVSSVGFYFNDEVTVKVKKTATGFKVLNFSTPILNRDGNSYEGLAGLSLLLVDLDYNGEVFDMEHAVYAKEMKEDGVVELPGVAELTAIIAIDRHGNESKPMLVKD